MTNISEKMLKQNYTMVICNQKTKKELCGLYLKKFPDGIHPYEIPVSELKRINALENIIEELNQGALLQVSKNEYLLTAIIGRRKTEGPYCESSYLEVIEEVTGRYYHEVLIDLNIKLSEKKNNKIETNKKLYKGAIRYE